MGGSRSDNTLKSAAVPGGPMPVSADQLRLAALAMVAAFALMALAGFGPSFRARREAPKPVRAQRQVPRPVEAAWVAVQAVILLSLLGALIFPAAVIGAPLSLLSHSQPALLWVGVAVFLAGAAYAGWAARHLGEQLTVAIELREGGRLVTTGPYARVRHPIYTGIFLMVGGLAVALADPVVAAFFAVAVYCGNFRARVEEALFASDAVHGRAYGDYLDRSGRFWPPRDASQRTSITLREP
jgi:protein-S-isoprenylcysteine O-methyltransferase Ste14